MKLYWTKTVQRMHAYLEKKTVSLQEKRKRGFVIVSASGASQVVNQTDDQHDGVNQQQTTAAAISDEGRRFVENGRGGGDSVVAVATAGSLRQRSVDSPAEQYRCARVPAAYSGGKVGILK